MQPINADSTRIATQRASFAMAMLPRDTTQVVGVIPTAGGGDIMWLANWARSQPTALARVAAYRALGLAALVGSSVWWGPGSCLDE